jgi:hypothetical protein
MFPNPIADPAAASINPILEDQFVLVALFIKILPWLVVSKTLLIKL